MEFEDQLKLRGERLSLAMAQKGYSQTRLSAESGLSQSAISAITGGRQRPYFDQIIKIASALDVSIDWIADREPPRPSLSEDETIVLRMMRAAGLSADDMMRAVTLYTRDRPAGDGESKVGPLRDETEADIRRERELSRPKRAERPATKPVERK